MLTTAFLPATPISTFVSLPSSSSSSSSSSSLRKHNGNASILPHQQHNRRRRRSHRPSIQMIDIDQNTIIGILVGLSGIVGGIGLVAWTEQQGQRTDKRSNDQPCFECKGETLTECNVCNGSKKNPIQPDQSCSYCDGVGTIKCFNCAGSGIQPRYLDRLSPEDFMD